MLLRVLCIVFTPGSLTRFSPGFSPGSLTRFPCQGISVYIGYIISQGFSLTRFLSRCFSLTRFSHQVPFSRNFCLYIGHHLTNFSLRRFFSHQVLSPGFPFSRNLFVYIYIYIGYISSHTRFFSHTRFLSQGFSLTRFFSQKVFFYLTGFQVSDHRFLPRFCFSKRHTPRGKNDACMRNHACETDFLTNHERTMCEARCKRTM